MLGDVRVINWPTPVALRNSNAPPLALASVLVLTVAPVPTGDMLSASQVVAARTTAVDATRPSSTTKSRGKKRISVFFRGVTAMLVVAGEHGGEKSGQGAKRWVEDPGQHN